jgi:hypothetical protein
MAFVEEEGRLSHLLPSHGQLLMVILGKAGLQGRGEAFLIFAVAEKVHDHPKHSHGIRVRPIPLREFPDFIDYCGGGEEEAVYSLVSIEFVFYFRTEGR